MKKSENPFSFKSFMNDGNAIKEIKTDKSRTAIETTSNDLLNLPKPEENPFSFKKLFPQTKKPSTNKASLQICESDENESSVKDINNDVLWDNVSSNSESECDTGSKSRKASDIFQQKPVSKKTKSNMVCDNPLFSSDDEDIFNNSSQCKLKPEDKDSISISSESDIDSDIKIQTKHKFSGSGIHYENNNTKEKESIRILKEQNKSLKRKVEQLSAEKEEQNKTINLLQKKIEELKEREIEETAALEDIIQQVESNLKTTTERAILAENKNEKFTEDIKSLQDKLTSLKIENSELSQKVNQSSGNNQVQDISKQLSAAANSAEHSLKQLLGGVENVKQLSEMLLSAERFTEVPSEQSDK